LCTGNCRDRDFKSCRNELPWCSLLTTLSHVVLLGGVLSYRSAVSYTLTTSGNPIYPTCSFFVPNEKTMCGSDSRWILAGWINSTNPLFAQDCLLHGSHKLSNKSASLYVPLVDGDYEACLSSPGESIPLERQTPNSLLDFADRLESDYQNSPKSQVFVNLFISFLVIYAFSLLQSIFYLLNRARSIYRTLPEPPSLPTSKGDVEMATSPPQRDSLGAVPI
jgi:hypothetical protein